jgi:hypothetical protein
MAVPKVAEARKRVVIDVRRMMAGIDVEIGLS